MDQKRQDELLSNLEVDQTLPWWLRWKLPPERPMILLVGRRGSGKTLLATEIACERMRAGQKVYANYSIVDRRNGNCAGRVHSMIDTLDLRDCTVVIDEANLWVSSREWSKIPTQVITGWQESRKTGVSFIFTSQHESRVDLIIRELVDWVYICERVPFVPRWVPLFRTQRTYLEEINEVRRGTVYRAEYRWVKHWVFAAYGTRDRVDFVPPEKLKAYQQAVKDGLDPDELGLGINERTEPCRIDLSTGTISPWVSEVPA